MADQELERLIVRIQGEAESYRKMLTEAQAATVRTAEQVQQAGAKIEDISKSLKGFASGALQALSSFGVATSLRGAFDSFAGAERGAVRLTAAIEANGKAVAPVLKDYQEFSKALTDVTLVTKGEVTAMLTKAEAMGLEGEQTKRAVKNAVALAAANGGSAENYIRATAAFEQGNVHLLRHTLPALRSIKDETQMVAEANRLMGTNFKLAMAEANTSSGQLTKLGRSLMSLNAEIGKLVADALMPVVAAVQRGVDWFKSLDEDTRRITVTVIALLGAYLAFGPAFSALSSIAGSLFGPFAAMFKLLYGLPNLFGMFTGGLSMLLTGLGSASGLLSGLLGTLFSFLNPLKLIMFGFSSIWTIIGLIGSVIGAVFSPIAIAAVLIVGLVESLGGVDKVWNDIKDVALDTWSMVKDAIADFIEWVQPIWYAFAGFAKAAWEAVANAARQAWEWIKSGFEGVRDFLKGIWTSVFGDSKLSWEAIKDYIRDTFIFFEFVVKNWGTTWDVIWTGAKYYFVKIINEILFFFTDVIPAYAKWFRDNWVDVFIDIFKVVINFFKQLFEKLWETIKNLPELIAGDKELADIWGDFGEKMKEGLSDAWDKVPDMGKMFKERNEGKLEAQLHKEFDQAKALFNKGFEEFLKERQAQIHEKIDAKLVLKKDEDRVAADALNLGETLGKNIESGVQKHTAHLKLDATLFRSVEALSRLYAQMDKNTPDPNQPIGAGVQQKLPVGNKQQVAMAPGVEKVLGEIRDILKHQGPGVQLQPAGLA